MASVIDVDRNDEVPSICGQIDAAPTYAVVLNAPRGNRPLASELGIRLLARHAEESGKAVAIATRSSSLASRARQAGIPVARKPQHVRWDAGGRRVFRLGPWSVAPPGFGGYVQVLVVLVLLAAIAGLALTMGPSATVIVSPPSRERSITVPVLALQDLDRTDIEGRRVPAHEVVETRTLTLTARTTGTAKVGVRAARTGVTLTNTGAADVTIPAGTVIVGPGEVRFLVEAEVVVAAGQGGVATASAAAPGEAGNVAPETLTKFADPAFASVRVTNATGATGGASDDVPAVAAADITAISALAKDLKTSNALRATAFTGERTDVVLHATLAIETEPGTAYPATGTASDLVFLDVTVTAKALAIPQDVLEQLAAGLLAEDAGEQLIPGSARARETGAIVASSESEDEGVRSELEVSARFASGVNEDDLIDAVKGKSPEDAESNLREQYGVIDPKVELSPGWAPWVPRFAFRISVEYRSEGSEGAQPGDESVDAEERPSPTPSPRP